MELPQAFLARMEGLLKEEYPTFLESYDSPPQKGLRLNPLKAGGKPPALPFSLSPVPWAQEGRYLEGEARPGRHPLHEAGAYYIQEPSAMAAVPFLDVCPGQRVLDLCAAPGGKSTQIAGRMRGEGFLLSNEIHPARAKILSQNMERMGVKNAYVTNEPPEVLASRFGGFFDRILVDAPCSGEGMFRKDEEARGEWSPKNVALCGERQLAVLEAAAGMLKEGGRLVYSTCTFSPLENEGTLFAFLTRHPEFSLLPLGEEGKSFGFAPGRPDWLPEELLKAESAPDPQVLKNALRLWPHRLKGEGHFIGILEKNRYTGEARQPAFAPRVPKEALALWESFAKETLVASFSGIPLLFGDQLYLAPPGAPDPAGMKVLRPGLHLGTVKKGRFEPAHALALALSPDQVRAASDFEAGSPEIAAYLRGESLPLDGEKGWRLVAADGFSLGWGKLSAGQLKNHYPKGLRRSF